MFSSRIVPSLVLALAATTATAEIVRYTNVTVLDPASESRLADHCLVVDGATIAAVASMSACPEADREIDMSGRFALPGFIDTHAHITLGPTKLVQSEQGMGMQVAYSPELTAHNAEKLLDFGVTAFRSPAGAPAANQAYKEAAADKHWPAAHLAGLVIERSPFEFEGLVQRVDSSEDVRAAVAEQAAAGVDAIKLYHSLTPAEVRAGIAAAHEAGLPAIGHLGFETSWTEAAEAGIDSLVHMMPTHPDLLPQARREDYKQTRRPGAFEFYQWYEQVDVEAPEIAEMIAALRDEEVTVDATLTVFHRTFYGNDEALLAPAREHVHADLLANWAAGFRFDAGWQAGDYERAQAVWSKVEALTLKLHQAGVHMTVGTDAGNPFVAPGESFHEEMRLLTKAGIPNWAVLRMATQSGAQSLGWGDRRGRLQPGFAADVVFLERDPSRDIGHSRDIAGVMIGGELVRERQSESR